MTIVEISYLKQSKDYKNLVLLNSYSSRTNPDYQQLLLNNSNLNYTSKNFDKKGVSVIVRIYGQSYYNSYREFSTIFCKRENLYKDIESLPFPIAIRAIEEDVYVIERPPFKTNVRLSIHRAYQSKKKNESPILCEVWIPWTVSILRLNNPETGFPSMKMYYNNEPLSSLDDLLCPAWTPNIHGHNNEMCLGETSYNFAKQVESGSLNPTNVQEVYNYIINDYFNGGWNMDLGAGLIQSLCNRNIGKLTRHLSDSPELVSRAKDKKIKIKRTDDNSRKSTFIKNNYINWSLLTLNEVLHAVEINKKYYNEYEIKNNTLNNIIKFNETDDNDEIKAINELAIKMRNINNNVKTWEINFIIPSNIIDENISKEHSLETVNECNLVQFGKLCANAANKIIINNRKAVSLLVDNALNSIADFYLNSNYIWNDKLSEEPKPITIELNLEKESITL